MNERTELIEAVVAAHRVLINTVESLDDAAVRRPSLLPGWTVGHVLTHLARHAASFVHMCAAAAEGRSVAQYPGGAEQRNGDIEAGAGRPARELIEDVHRAADALEATWADLPEAAWALSADTMVGPARIDDLPFRRWREAVVHTSDLGLHYTWRDWPAPYVRAELPRLTMLWSSRSPMGMTTLPAEALAVDDTQRVAWLLGRADIDRLDACRLFG